MSFPDPMADPNRRAHLALSTTQSTRFGQGWISGVLSVALGLIGLGAVLCFRFPGLLTIPQAREFYPVPIVRALLHLVLVTAFLLGVLSITLRYNKALGLAGITAVLLATLLGGSQVPLDGELQNGPFLGLDWFLMSLILYSAVYVPLERLWPLHPEQPIFRRGWLTDLTYFMFSGLLVQVTSLLTMHPAMALFGWARHPAVTQPIASLSLLVQVPLILIVADLTQYWVHRAFHTVPALWKFHAVHHSTTAMDWLAGSRLHLIDAIVTRGTSYIPIYVLGFSEPAIAAYVVIVVIQATFIHANVRWTFGPLRWLVATPAFHHWHHSAQAEAIDKNFAVHLPVWDWLFGTCHLPNRWPEGYGLAGGDDVPEGWGRQFVFPFRRRGTKSSNL